MPEKGRLRTGESETGLDVTERDHHSAEDLEGREDQEELNCMKERVPI
jgi:hypothetical protein